MQKWVSKIVSVTIYVPLKMVGKNIKELEKRLIFFYFNINASHALKAILYYLLKNKSIQLTKKIIYKQSFTIFFYLPHVMGLPQFYFQDSLELSQGF